MTVQDVQTHVYHVLTHPTASIVKQAPGVHFVNIRAPIAPMPVLRMKDVVKTVGINTMHTRLVMATFVKNAWKIAKTVPAATPARNVYKDIS